MSSPLERTEKIRRMQVRPTMGLLEAMKVMNEVGTGVLFVTGADQGLVGSLTTGDMRRWITSSGGKLDVQVGQVCNKSPQVLAPGHDREQTLAMMRDRQINAMPVIKDGQVVDILTWDEVTGARVAPRTQVSGVNAVIMAGGIGSRMRPFTHVLPKPLLPIRERVVLQVIMDNFHAFGISKFQVVVNHKKSLIEAYFQGIETGYTVDFVDEGEALGTCGGLTRLDPDTISDPFFLSNCDTILDADFAEVVAFHRERNHDATVLCTARDFTVPYGVLHLDEGGQLQQMVEKPSIKFLVNTGVYLLNKSLLPFLTAGKPCGTPDLIGRGMASGLKAGAFPLPEAARLDTGQWDEYRKTLEEIEQRPGDFLK